MTETNELLNGNIVLDKFGDSTILTGIDAEKQIIRNALLIFFGTWFDDPLIGVKWLQILTKSFNINTIKAEIERNLLLIFFVTEVVTINLGNVGADRNANLTFVVRTTTGNTITFEENL